MSAPSNHTELSASASMPLSMLKDKPNDWSESVDLAGQNRFFEALVHGSDCWHHGMAISVRRQGTGHGGSCTSRSMRKQGRLSPPT